MVGEDYAMLSQYGIRAVRDGVRWHRIETTPGNYDWNGFLPMLRAANAAGTQVIWDLCHYGWPDDLDIWSAAFIDRFARFSAAVARLVRAEIDHSPIYCPINEMSFWAWAGGEVGRFNPCEQGRGGELKRQLVRATIAAVDAIREADPRARFITAEPLIHVEIGLGDKEHAERARAYRQSQFEAFDMLCGDREPELGGGPEYLDLVGLNYYPDNQWYHGGTTIPLGHHAYRPLHEMLMESHRRYERPLLIAETGGEGCGRAAWLHYVCSEVYAALEAGVPIQGICLYPITDYPGWDNERWCRVGLLSAPGLDGRRTVCPRLARELQQQRDAVEFGISAPAQLLVPAE